MTDKTLAVYFDGKTYEAGRDKTRLKKQLDLVREAMSDSSWRTLSQVAAVIGAPEASVSARLRDLRKKMFGHYIVERQYVMRGLWKYRMLSRDIEHQREMAFEGVE